MTRVLRTREELRAALGAAPRPIGLVTTMGWLHEGHGSLMARARAENATTVVTIFVNPRQFGDASDFTRYPRDEARDIAICEAEGVDIVWAPPVEEVYVPRPDTTVTVGAVAGPLKERPVPATSQESPRSSPSCSSLVRADRAYFGQKDAQQVMVIRRMALDLAIGTEVVACPTVREPDGLALSSRNVHLKGEDRPAAGSAPSGTPRGPASAGPPVSDRGMPCGRRVRRPRGGAPGRSRIRVGRRSGDARGARPDRRTERCSRSPSASARRG